MQFLYMFIKQKLYQIIENYRRNIILISLGGGGGVVCLKILTAS